MKPKNILQDGRTEASALLFAHDSKSAQEILLGKYQGDKAKTQEGMPKKRHQDFITFVVEDWVAEITTETSVTLEFVDRQERDSITSSICYFAKAEEISERMSDAYPVNTDDRYNDLQASHMSTEAYNLVNNF